MLKQASKARAYIILHSGGTPRLPCFWIFYLLFSFFSLPLKLKKKRKRSRERADKSKARRKRVLKLTVHPRPLSRHLFYSSSLLTPTKTVLIFVKSLIFSMFLLFRYWEVKERKLGFQVVNIFVISPKIGYSLIQNAAFYLVCVNCTILRSIFFFNFPVILSFLFFRLLLTLCIYFVFLVSLVYFFLDF